ncbi:arabinofuranosyltransferase [Actinomadura rugatobispora]|uniref:Arabinofuranosyltransferase n=1 Tax=Actinomadura rugatobispora TaxID=1994 RepID=A0ABW0ZLY3_9ACTN|nr:hypothetical protein GCM10010200_093460 [Actinomadura rugatobispora]
MPHDAVRPVRGSAPAPVPGAARGDGASVRWPRRTPPRAVRAFRRPEVAAVVSWAVLLPVAMSLPSWARADPFTPRGTILPLALMGMLAAGGLAACALTRGRWRPLRDPLAGAAAGALAAWVALMLRTMLHGTPFGFAGLAGDMGRLTALATRYSATAASADGIVADVPGEYPPLYPWLIGRTAALADVPAWRLLGEAEVLTVSAAVLVSFLLWRRLVGAPVALAVAAAGLAVFADPRKAYEVIALFVFVPWVLAAIGTPPRGRWHWLPAGLLGGLLVLTYQGYLLWASLGLVALAALTWRAAEDRRACLLHLVKLTLVAAAVSAWYLVPYAWTLARDGGQLVADLYRAPAIDENPFPFTAMTPPGVLEAIGLAGLLWYRRTAWWAAPLLCLVAGTYAYRVIGMVRFAVTGHTGLFYHSTRMVGLALIVAGVLTIVRAGPGLARRLAGRPAAPAGFAATALAVLIAWTGAVYWQAWKPDPGAARTSPGGYAARAHTEPLPDGRRPRYAPARPEVPWFPVTPIRNAVASVLGPGAAPRTLSYDERLFSYLPWPGYTTADRTSASSLVRWDERRAALARLAAVTDPAAFSRAAARTAFGRIDLFVLRTEGGSWTWGDIRFAPRQFDPAAFAVIPGLPENTVVAIRRPGR